MSPLSIPEAPYSQTQSDVEGMDNDIIKVAEHSLFCAQSWAPEARLIGNARAGDLAQLFMQFLHPGHAPILDEKTYLKTLHDIECLQKAALDYELSKIDTTTQASSGRGDQSVWRSV